MSNPKTKYPRVGDYVTIIDPSPIERIGYEICVETVILEVEKDPLVIAFIKSQRLLESSADRIYRTVAVSRVHDLIKKGAERKIFYAESRDEYKGETFKVLDKRVRQVGFYYPSSAGCIRGGSEYGYDYDYEPAGLDDRKTVICLCLNCCAYLTIHNKGTEWNEGFWLTANQITWKGKQ